VCADINDVEYRKVMLDKDYQISADKLLAACDANTKAIWICSPNNPTGNNIRSEEIEKVIELFDGIVVVDEAYIDFSTQKTFSRYAGNDDSNVIVLQTMSKAWGSAAIRLGMAFAKKEIIGIFNKVKYPYNVNMLTQEQAMKRLNDIQAVSVWVNILLQERGRMVEAFAELPICEKVYPTDANFFLAKVKDAQGTYDYLVEKGIIVRNRTRITLCNNCLRVTIGTREENNELLGALRSMK
jgi:histidinol-phosphate aminotransferase